MFHLNYMVGEQACKMIAHYFQQDCREPLLICYFLLFSRIAPSQELDLEIAARASTALGG